MKPTKQDALYKIRAGIYSIRGGAAIFWRGILEYLGLYHYPDINCQRRKAEGGGDE